MSFRSIIEIDLFDLLSLVAFDGYLFAQVAGKVDRTAGQLHAESLPAERLCSQYSPLRVSLLRVEHHFELPVKRVLGSPLAAHRRGSFPRMQTVHGQQDEIVPVEQAVRLDYTIHNNCAIDS